MDELNRKSVEEFRRSEKIPVIAVLDNVRSMNNVGSIFRSSDAFLLESIYLCGYTPRPPHRDINKTALGATDTVTWEYHENIVPAIDLLKQKGYLIYAVEQAEGSVMLNDLVVDKSAKIALVFGNEVEGVQDEVINICDQCIEIPQSGMKHSLNISVAAGIVFWQFFKQYSL
jgi:23S rRNA (guanosine2251-2'-O)-methyltransferase